MPTATFPEINAAGKGQLYARFVTTMGNIVVRLEEERAPKTVKNFVGLATGTQEWAHPRTGQVQKGVPYYDGTIFHRVIPEFMIQGVLSMANSGPSTNGSQFFLTERATPHLDNRHTVFGFAVAGADIIKKIARVATGARDKPAQDVVLQKLEIFRSESVPSS